MSELTITTEDYQRLLGQAMAENHALRRYIVELEQREKAAEPSQEPSE